MQNGALLAMEIYQNSRNKVQIGRYVSNLVIDMTSPMVYLYNIIKPTSTFRVYKLAQLDLL